MSDIFASAGYAAKKQKSISASAQPGINLVFNQDVYPQLLMNVWSTVGMHASGIQSCPDEHSRKVWLNFASGSIMLNTRFYEQYPDWFEVGLLTNPVGTTKNGISIAAMTLNLSSRASWKFDDEAMAMPEYMIDEVFKALDEQYGYYEKNGHDVIPYVPLQIMKAVDPSTFEPMIGFKTRFAHYKR